MTIQKYIQMVKEKIICCLRSFMNWEEKILYTNN